MNRSRTVRRTQRGSATLLVALTLMMALTIATLSVARTQLVERRIAGNHHWHTRLLLRAEAGLATGFQLLTGYQAGLSWHALADGTGEFSRVGLSEEADDIDTQIILRRPHAGASFVLIEASSIRNDGSGMQVRSRQLVRPLSLLSPLGESAPPLVVKGCITATPASLEVRPLNAYLDHAGDAVWLDSDSRCQPGPGIVTHRGVISDRPLGEDLWSSMLSIDRDRFSALAVQQEALPENQRTYWIAAPDDLAAGRWLRSAGTPQRPVAIYFPAEIGCPRFGPGVQIHGLAFIDADCRISAQGLEIYGTLMINGNLDARGARLRLNHIQVADSDQEHLRFPVLRNIPVPGSWRDF